MLDDVTKPARTMSRINPRNFLRWTHDLLSCSDPLADSDLIFVLSGRKSRKAHALELLRCGRAPKILLSVGRFELRHFPKLDLPVPVDMLKIAASVPPPQRHYFVTFEKQQVQVERIAMRRFGTLSEIEALAIWLDRHPQVTSVLVVSSGFHLRRILICCRALLPRQVVVRLNAVPNEALSEQREQWWRHKESRRMVISELVKIPCYAFLLALRSIRRRP
jgi:hypothetical protein